MSIRSAAALAFTVIALSGILTAGARPQAPSTLVQRPKWWSGLPRAGFSRLEKVGTYQGWYEVYRLTPDTLAIYEPFQFQEAISYLVIGSRKAALVDTGNGIGRIRDVVTALTRLPVSVILTHEHADHFGGAAAFDHVALYDLPSAFERVQQGVPNAQARRSITGDNIWKPLPSGVSPETWSVLPVRPDTRLHDGDVIDLGGRSLEVIHSPGHTPGSIALLDKGRRLIFTGDHFYPGPLYLHSAMADLRAFQTSNDRLAARVREYDHVLGGHNEPWIEAAAMPRVSEAMRTILSGGGTFAEDEGLRRYRFEGFDILLRASQLAR